MEQEKLNWEEIFSYANHIESKLLITRLINQKRNKRKNRIE